jgi:hypothetical protein
MENKSVIEQIKKSFCNLTSFKERHNALEIITAFSTINNKFVSVFVTLTKDKIIVTDSGWIDQNYYETPYFEESEDLITRIITTYSVSYKIKSTLDKSGTKFYYKNCKNINEVPSAVFDLANFIVGAINSYCIQYKDEKEEKERESFKSDANLFLKVNYAKNVKIRGSLDDFQNIKFNAVIEKSSKLYLINYVTGSTQNYFENDLRKSVVNFEIAEKSKYKSQIKERITIINNNSDGFQPLKSSTIFELLSEKMTREPIKWTEREKILEFI